MKKFLRKLLIGFTALSTIAIVGASLATSVKKVDEVSATETPITTYSKIYRFTAPAEYWGGTVYIHIWGSSTSSNNTTWPGINISNEYSFNESSRKVYTFGTNVTDYKYVIFHNNSGWQTDDITIGTNTAWYLDSGNTPGTWTPTNQTFYLYDYKNMFGGAAKCYAWQSNGSLINADYPGVAMTSVQYGSGQLYTISLDPAFDMAKFGVGDSANTGDQWINQHRGACFCWWDVGDSTWDADIDHVRAHDWIYETMHVRDIDSSDKSDTGACRGANGYYQKAKTAYQNFTTSIKTKISEDACFSIATARFHDWAVANGEDASITGTTLTVNNVNVLATDDVKSSTITVIATFVLSAFGIGTFFVFQRKKKLHK